MTERILHRSFATHTWRERGEDSAVGAMQGLESEVASDGRAR